MANVSLKDRDIAMVFQNYALYPHMTVYDNMAFGLKLRKFSARRVARISSSILTENQRLFQAVRDSVLLSVVLSFVTRRYSFLTNRFQTLMLSSVLR